MSSEPTTDPSHPNPYKDEIVISWPELHRDAERTGLIADMLHGRADRRGYVLLLRNLQPAYKALERGLDAHRESAILGLVGAGGIGVAPDAAMNNLYWDQVGLILLVIFAVVMATEFVTNAIRNYLI